MARRYVDELRISAKSEDELADHGVSPDEAVEVSWNGPRFFRDKIQRRELMIGRTHGGRLLTIVVQPANEHGAWDVVTGWDASTGEATEWKKAK